MALTTDFKPPIDETFNFRLFQNCALPLPNADKKKVFIWCKNLSDGVGDAYNAFNFAQRVKQQLNDAGYEVIGVFQLEMIPEEPEHIFNKRANQVKAQLADSRALFDDVYIFESNQRCDEVDYQGGAQSKILKNNILDDHLKSAADIVISLSPSQLFTELREEGITLDRSKIVTIPYLHDITFQLYNSMTSERVLNFAAPSLGRRDKKNELPPYGLNLQVGKFVTQQDKARRLLNFSNADQSKGREFLKALLNTPQPTLEQSEAYLKTHVLCPGYPQLKNQSAPFVMTTLLKYCDQYNQLNQNVDFHLPSNAMSPELIKMLANQFGLENIEWITPIKVTQLCNENPNLPYKIRIFTGYFLNEEDYKDMYSLSSGIAQCSGENTIYTVLSSDHLPYFQSKYGCISGFLYDELLPFIAKVKDSLENNHQLSDDLREGFNGLTKYFLIQLAECAMSPERLRLELAQYDMQDEICHLPFLSADPQNTDVGNDLLFINHNLDKYLNHLRKLGEYAKDENVLNAWSLVRQQIIEDYNYNDHLTAILAGALYLHNPNPLQQPSLMSILMQSKYLNDLQTKGYLSPELIRRMRLEHAKILAVTEVYEKIQDAQDIEVLFDLIEKTNKIQLSSIIEQFINTPKTRPQPLIHTHTNQETHKSKDAISQSIDGLSKPRK